MVFCQNVNGFSWTVVLNNLKCEYCCLLFPLMLEFYHTYNTPITTVHENPLTIL